MMNPDKNIDIIERKVIPDTRRHFLTVEEYSNSFLPRFFHLKKGEEVLMKHKLNVLQ